jgi:ubiquinone/menaquinone biosynthesis C-methylase UbiE
LDPMRRVPEPEVMDDPEQALAYARADFADVNQRFVDRFRAEFPSFGRGQVLDLGCGPADIPIRLARALPSIQITAVDASGAMLELARRDIEEAGLAANVTLVRARLPRLPWRDRTFDALVSNSLLHHLPDPSVFWDEVRRLSRPGARLLVVDLCRPRSATAARDLVEAAAADEPAVLRRDFFNSLLAAFTSDEVDEQLGRAGLGHLRTRIVSDRHWAVAGMSYAP